MGSFGPFCLVYEPEKRIIAASLEKYYSRSRISMNSSPVMVSFW